MKIKHSSDIKYYSFDGTNPGLDWIYILLIFFLAMVYFVGGGVMLSLSKNEADLNSNKNTPPAVAQLNKNALDKVIRGFDLKKNDRATYSAGYGGPADPSGL
jgi:hypothetical protein